MWFKQYQNKNYRTIRSAKLVLSVVALISMGTTLPAQAITPLPIPPPQSGSYGLEATKTQPPPKTAATITTPGNGSSFSTSPITVSGLCSGDLLVQIYNNGVLVGSIDCKGGSFSLQVGLFTGQNDLYATQFDDLDQPSPDSNHVTVSYNNANFTAFGAIMTLTSNYGRRGADPGSTLTWPLQLSGGTGPYAFSIDWGDGKPAELKSQALAGEVTISHVYKNAGIYHVTIKATDANGVTAFLQVVAISNGTPTKATTTDKNKAVATVTKVLWIPAAICLILLLPTYWLGRRSELYSLHRALEKNIAEATRKEGPSPGTVETEKKDGEEKPAETPESAEAVEKPAESDKKE